MPDCCDLFIEDTLLITLMAPDEEKQGTKQLELALLFVMQTESISEHAFGVGRRTNVYDGESLALMAGRKLACQYCLEHPKHHNITFLFR
jgi:hypothetical protein